LINSHPTQVSLLSLIAPVVGPNSIRELVDLFWPAERMTPQTAGGG